MRFRKLRIAWSVGWGLAAVLLIVLLVRGSQGPELHYQNWGPRLYCLESCNGRLTYWHINSLIIRDPPAMAHASADDVHSVIQAMYESNALFGFLRRAGVIVFAPIWFPILLCGSASLLPWTYRPKWRFSLRTLLSATALVAAVLGLVMWASR